MNLLNERFDILGILELVGVVLGQFWVQVCFTIHPARFLAVGLLGVNCRHAEVALLLIHCVCGWLVKPFADVALGASVRVIIPLRQEARELF